MFRDERPDRACAGQKQARSKQESKKTMPTFFEKPSSSTDVVFIVEERELHFTKSFLIASSPVFERMFNSDFREKTASHVALPDKTYNDMNLFLQHFHPAHSWKSDLINDDSLEILLRLADEYEVDHIFLKCQHYICEQLKTLRSAPIQRRYSSAYQAAYLQPGFQFEFRDDPYDVFNSQEYEFMVDNLTPNRSQCASSRQQHQHFHQGLLYLQMCDQYKLSEPEEDKLVKIVASRSVQELEADDCYTVLSDSAKFAVMRERCCRLETLEQIELWCSSHHALPPTTRNLARLTHELRGQMG